MIKFEQLIHEIHFDENMTAIGLLKFFKIARRYMRQDQPIYTVVDWYDKPVEGAFYQKEFQKVESTNEDIFKIESVLKYKGRGKDKQALVKWKVWPKKFNSWIPASNLVTY